MEVKVDLTNVPSNELPEGVYTFRVHKCEQQESKNTPGTQTLAVELVVTDPGEFEGRHAFDNISLQPHVLWRVRDFVNACGVFPGPEGFKTEDLLGRPVRAMITLQDDKQNPGQKRGRPGHYAAV